MMWSLTDRNILDTIMYETYRYTLLHSSELKLSDCSVFFKISIVPQMTSVHKVSHVQINYSVTMIIIIIVD